jgi:murein L,D-transpeptidase YcbB/YkuD
VLLPALIALLLAQAPAPTQVQVLLHARFPASGAPPQLRIGDESFRGSTGLPCFYERRGYAPAWSAADAGALLETLDRAGGEGLRPEEYRGAALRQLAEAAESPSQTADFDLLLTDAFLRYASHVQSGRVDPERLYSDCQGTPPKAYLPNTDLPAVLEAALGSGSLRQVLDALPPPHEGYRRLRAALARYRQVEARGGWVAVPDGPTLRRGNRGERVEALRLRLVQAAVADAADAANAADTANLPAGDTAAGPPTPADVFDKPLAAAVQAFQERHGLDADGVAGAATLRALAEPAAAHVRQIELNLERWRWLPRDLGKRYVLVNIAGFGLDAVEDGRTALAMKVIVGKPYTRTPLFSGLMTRVIINPSWYVPNSIITKEIAPRLGRDPGYIQRENFEVLPTRDGRLALRQRPGPNNALGRIKFLFPNRFNVYLHDTPSRSLFGRTVRTFSHGCIRIEKPLEMAEWVLGPEWTPETIQAAIATGKERTVPVLRPIPVHVTYATAWVDAAGTLQIRTDVYGRDKPLDEALGE